MFHVGQKVVCVHPGPWFDINTNIPAIRGTHPELGSVYVVVHCNNHPVLPEYPFVEIDAFPRVMLDARCFRPVVERKTDISIFKKMLTPELVE